jgi:hypothetical protein
MLADTDQVVREIIDRSKPAATSTRLSMVAVAAVSLSLARRRRMRDLRQESG